LFKIRCFSCDREMETDLAFCDGPTVCGDCDRKLGFDFYD